MPEDRSRRTEQKEHRQGRVRVRTELGTRTEGGMRMRIEVRI
jgi:hypothetical protein